MKRSQLSEVIKSIVARKLNEDSSDRGTQLASSLRKIFDGGGSVHKVTIQTHHGDEPLEVVEWWIHSDELHIGVVADSPSKLQEAGSTNMFGAPSPQTQSTLPKDDAPEPAESPTEGMSEQDKKQLSDAQKQQQKLTSDRDRLKGAIQKLEEPVRRKVADAERKAASIEQKLGQVTKKIQDIQKKYQKV